MNFFSQQEKARRQTRLLVFLFVIAVVCILLVINLIFFFALQSQSVATGNFIDWFKQPFWLYVSVPALIIIVGASLWRSWQLKSSPEAIAKLVNASRVSMDSTDSQERRLINVVEEMAIASGTPIPKMYIIKEEPGLNAFVAGFDSSDIVLVVTQGLLDHLNREELQGVIGHEYSHVFHGDMRLNIRLMGIVSGILVIGQLGQLLMNGGRYGTGYRSVSSSKRNGNAGVVLIVGLGLFAVGYIGLFFGRLIKAAISRQREFLADASAVQFTRNPDGIAGALLKIRDHGSVLHSAKAEEMSHMCFGMSVKQKFGGWLATHPPINDRIKAINPRLARSDRKRTLKSSTATSESNLEQNNDYQHMGFAPTTNDDVGRVTPENLDAAKSTLSSLPTNLVAAASGQSGINSIYEVAVSLVISNTSEAKDRTEKIKTVSPFDGINERNILSIDKQISPLDFVQKHALLDILLASIDTQTDEHKQYLVKLLSKVSSSKRQIKLSEFLYYGSMLKRCLPQRKQTKTFNNYRQARHILLPVIGLLVQESKLSRNDLHLKFGGQLKSFGLTEEDCMNCQPELADLSLALNKLSQLNPLLKQGFVEFCFDIILADNHITQKEQEIYRLLCEFIGSPLALPLQNT